MVEEHPPVYDDNDIEELESQSKEEVEEEEEEEEQESRLKYQRLGGNIPSLLSKSSVSSIAVTKKVIPLGTHDGIVNIFDIQGNQVKEFHSHTATVNDISFDMLGEYIGSCSDDGSVVINNLFTDDEVMKFEYHRPIKAIALDPDYLRKSSRKFVTGGLSGQLFLNSKKWLGCREDQVLHSGEGPIHSVKWRKSLVAWADDVAARIYDLPNNRSIASIERPSGGPLPEQLRPQIVWQDDTRLVIGWGTFIKVIAIRVNPPRGASGILESFQIPTIKYVDTVSSFVTNCYISGVAPYGDALVVLAYLPEGEEGGKEFSTGALPRQQGTKTQRLEMRIVTWKNDELAADVLPLHGFQNYKANDYVLAHAPFTGSSYAGGQWAAADQPLYYLVSPKNVVVARPRNNEDDIAWLVQHKWHKKALAVREAGQGPIPLCTELMKPDIFHLVEKYNIHDAIKDKVAQLMLLDCKRAVTMLIQHRDVLLPSDVVRQLLHFNKKANKKYFLYLYLHSLYQADTEAGWEFHDLQVQLYAEYEHRMLLSFLHSSQHYKLDKAYEVCLKKDLAREQIFILERMGDFRQALVVIINKLEDIEQAMAFVSMHDDELWEELVKQCVVKPKLVGVLLENTCGHLKPLDIIRLIPSGLEIPRLKDHLQKIINDYQTEISLGCGCNDILKADCFNLSDKYFKEVKRGIRLGSTEEETVIKRRDCVPKRSSTRPNKMKPVLKTRGHGRCGLCFDPLNSIQEDSSVVAFFCCHAYHMRCLRDFLESVEGGSSDLDDDEEEDNEDDAQCGISRLHCILCTTAGGQ